MGLRKHDINGAAANGKSLPLILPPSEDGIFKTLLTHPDAKPVLRDVISSILHTDVEDVEVRNTEMPIADINEKRERFDVNCRTGSGEQIAIEMQSEAMEGDNAENSHASMIGRAIYNLCDLHSSQPGRTIRYDKLMRSYQVTFCGYTIFPDMEDFANRFLFRNESGYELSKAIGVIFVELTKLRQISKKDIEDMTSLEKWALFFAYADKPKFKELMDKINATKGEIKMASELLMSISSDETQRAHYLSRKGWLMDREHEHAVWRDEGIAQGIEQGGAIALDLIRKGYTIEEAERILKQKYDVVG